MDAVKIGFTVFAASVPVSPDLFDLAMLLSVRWQYNHPVFL